MSTALPLVFKQKLNLVCINKVEDIKHRSFKWSSPSPIGCLKAFNINTEMMSKDLIVVRTLGTHSMIDRMRFKNHSLWEFLNYCISSTNALSGFWQFSTPAPSKSQRLVCNLIEKAIHYRHNPHKRSLKCN